MKRFYPPFSIAILIASTFFCLMPRAQAQMEIPPIAMVAQTDRSEYSLGEPVILKVRIYNWSSPLLTLTSSFGLQGMSDLRIIHNGETGERYRAHLEETPLSNKKIKLPYGKAYEFRIIAVYDPQNPSGLAFSEPGVYQLQLNQYMEYTNEFATSEGQTPYPLVVETPGFRVIPPSPEAANALKILQSVRDGIRDLNRAMASPATRDAFEKVAREYPNSPYAPYCLHALGSLSASLMASVEGETEKSEWAYKELINKYPNYPLRDEVRLQLARFYANSHRMNLCRSIIEELLAESEDNFYRYRDIEILQPYRGAIDNPNAAINRQHWDIFQTTQLPDAYEQIKIEQLK